MNSRESREQQGSRVDQRTSWKQAERVEPDKGDRAETKGKSKAKNHALQELVYRQVATLEARNHKPIDDQ